MQDQLTGGNTNLQQQQGNLQQNTPNLQQSGSGTSTDNVSSLLSENAPSGQLQVTTLSNSTTSIQPDQTTPHTGPTTLLLWLIVILVLAVMYVGYMLWSRAARPQAVTNPDETDELLVAEESQPQKAPKAKKKAPKHRRPKRR